MDGSAAPPEMSPPAAPAPAAAPMLLASASLQSVLSSLHSLGPQLESTSSSDSQLTASAEASYLSLVSSLLSAFSMLTSSSRSFVTSNLSLECQLDQLLGTDSKMTRLRSHLSDVELFVDALVKEEAAALERERVERKEMRS